MIMVFRKKVYHNNKKSIKNYNESRTADKRNSIVKGSILIASSALKLHLFENCCVDVSPNAIAPLSLKQATFFTVELSLTLVLPKIRL